MPAVLDLRFIPEREMGRALMAVQFIRRAGREETNELVPQEVRIGLDILATKHGLHKGPILTRPAVSGAKTGVSESGPKWSAIVRERHFKAAYRKLVPSLLCPTP